MQGANIFLSDKIRIHALDFTPDGLGMASQPFVVLDPDTEEAILEMALLEALDQSRDGVPNRALTREEEQAYYEALGITSHKDLGRGADIIREEDVFTVTPVDEKGRFGDPVVTDEKGLIGAVKACLGLWPLAENGRQPAVQS